VMVVVACVLAGLGLTALVYLALFGLAVLGLSLLAAPFAKITQVDPADAKDEMPGDYLSAS
jgi:hypothetical protein